MLIWDIVISQNSDEEIRAGHTTDAADSRKYNSSVMVMANGDGDDKTVTVLIGRVDILRYFMHTGNTRTDGIVSNDGCQQLLPVEAVRQVLWCS